MINRESSLKVSEQRRKLREIMWNDAHIVRTREGLERTKKALSEMLEEMADVRAENYGDLKKKTSLENLLLTGLSITEAALLRRETRGPRYREDFPDTERSFEKPILLHLKGKEVEGRL
jgi:succinate dehydrogenase/fumarate reductase flavoprotein subunit